MPPSFHDSRRRWARNQADFCVIFKSRCSFMLDTLLRLVMNRYIAIIQTRNPNLEPSITVPVLALKRLAHCFSRQR